MLERFHAATFGAQVNTTFRIHLPPMHVMDVELVEVTEGHAAVEQRPGAAARHERFSMVFRGPQDRLLQQGVYQMQHKQLGAFELFLVPVGQDKVGLWSALSSYRQTFLGATMHSSALTHPYKHYRFPAEIISHGVWLYYRFCLSYRDVEELLCVRGVIVSYEAIRKWGGSAANSMPISSAIGAPSTGISGTSMKSFCPSMVNATTSGAR